MFRNRCFWHWQYLGGKPRQRGEPDYTRMKTPVTKTYCSESIWFTQNVLLGTRQEMQGIVDAVVKVLANRDALLKYHPEQKRK